MALPHIEVEDLIQAAGADGTEGGVVAHLAVGGRVLQDGPKATLLEGISVEIARLNCNPNLINHR